MKILFIFDLFLLSIHYAKSVYYLLNMYQQNHYDIKKYVFSLKTFYLSKIYNYLYYFIAVFFIIGFCANQIIVYYICYTLALILLLISFLFNDTFVIRLKFTARIYRLIATICIIIIGLCFVFFLFNVPYFSAIIGLILPFIIIVSSWMNQPLESSIKKKYKKKAINKLSSFSNTIKIAITGSFGKTSTKNILYQVLSSKYNVTKTPKSYNTMMGLAKTINEELREDCEIFLVEMGAFKKGEIEEMSMAILPNIAIITEVGPQHLSTFKTLDNVLNAKFEIIKGLSGAIILNDDNELIRDYAINNELNAIDFGINHGIYRAKNISFQNHTTSFDIYKGDTFKTSIQTMLLAKHNIYNILCAYATIQVLETYHINISDDEFQKEIEKLKPSEHRLSYKYLAPFHIYDDSYSANVNGFKNALEVLKNQTGIKCIITPGVVDGGAYEEEMNICIARDLVDGIDEIYVIKNKASLPIIKFLEEKKKSYKVFSKFMDAYLDLTKKYLNSKDDVHILIENDLPDSFLER